MGPEELFKKIFTNFFMIVTGVVCSMYLFCLIFNTDASFTLSDIGRILLMAAGSDLTFVVYFSRRELGRKQMYLRMVLHFVLLFVVLLYFASSWDWVNIRSVKETTVFVTTVLLVYLMVFLINKVKDKKLSDKLNDRLKQRYKEQ